MDTLSRLFIRTDSFYTSTDLGLLAESFYDITKSVLEKDIRKSPELLKFQKLGVAVRLRALEKSGEIRIIIGTSKESILSLCNPAKNCKERIDELIDFYRSVCISVREEIKTKLSEKNVLVEKTLITTGRLTKLRGLFRMVKKRGYKIDDALKKAEQYFMRVNKDIVTKFIGNLRESLSGISPIITTGETRTHSVTGYIGKPRQKLIRGFVIFRNPGSESIIRRKMVSH